MPRDFTDFPALRQKVFDQALAGVQHAFPIENERFRLELEDPHYDNPRDYSLADQKKAILGDKTLSWRLAGTWKLYDRASNQLLGQQPAVLAHVPYLTERGTLIGNGTEYVVSNQYRLKPGVYARRAASGELVAQVNVRPRTGPSFSVALEPASGRFRMLMGQARIPLYPILRSMGVKDADLRAAWGDDIFAANRSEDSKAVQKVRQYLRLPTDSGEQAGAQLTNVFSRMELDPDVMQRNLGLRSDRISPDVLVRTAGKLVRVNRNEEQEDDRDALYNQTLHSIDDFVYERIAKDRAGVARRLMNKLTFKGGDLKVLRHGSLNPYFSSLLSGSGVAGNLEEINPLEILDQHYRVVRTGEGGIRSIDAIPESARQVHISQAGFVDPIRGPESGKLGVDSRIAWGAVKVGNQLMAPFLDRDGNTVYLKPEELADAVVAFPNDGQSPVVRASIRGKLGFISRDKIDYSMPDGSSQYSLIGNLVPLFSGTKGNRYLMGAKYGLQALPLKEPEAPLVEAAAPDGRSFQDHVSGFLGAIRSELDGQVIKVTPSEIVVRTPDGKRTYQLYDNFPFNRKTHWHSTPLVSAGQKVRAGTLLAHSNFTDPQGRMAIGRNLSVAYMPYRFDGGVNYEDAAIISESASRKLTSEHMYTRRLEDEDLKPVDRSKFLSVQPGAFSRKQLERVDDRGVVRPGTLVQKGDPLILSLGTIDERASARLHRNVKFTPPDKSLRWDSETPGVVTDVVDTPGGPKVIIKSYEQAQVADKIAGRYGDKHTIAAIVPDDRMPRGSDDQPFDVIVNPLGVISRVNPCQVIEAALGKVAAKTGKTYVRPSFDPEDRLKFAIRELKRHGLKSTDTVYDPASERKIERVLTGKRYYMKLSHQAEHKLAGRAATGDPDTAYTIDRLPAGGGPTGSKRIGLAEQNALISHGAFGVMRDSHLVRGQRNDDYWRAMRMGNELPTPRGGFLYDKLYSYMRASGINTTRRGDHIHFMALTDKDTETLSHGEITNPETVSANTLEPRAGGLFDPRVTGGHDGTFWSHINLTEPLPNPVMEDVTRHLLGLTRKELREVIAGREKLNGETGPPALRKALERYRVDNEIERARLDMKSGSATRRDSAVRRLGYLEMMKQTGIKPLDLLWTKVPVLPPAFRPIVSLGKNKPVLTSGANELYRDVMRMNATLGKLKEELGDEHVGDERLSLYDALKAVSGLGDPVGRVSRDKKVRGLLRQLFGNSPKLGMIQRLVVGRPQDMVGRAVITPDAGLDLDEVGLPEDKAWVIYAPFVVRRMVRGGVDRMDAAKAVAQRTDRAKAALEEEMQSRPVLVNRAPTLHRFSIQAAWPKLRKGHTLMIPPMVTAGYSADFDGNCFSGSTRVLVRFALRDPLGDRDPMRVVEQLYDMKFSSGETARSLPQDDFATIEMKLQDFPYRKHTRQLDRNGASVYQVPDGVQVWSYNHAAVSGQYSPVNYLTIEQDVEVAKVTTRDGHEVVASTNESLCFYDVRTGSLAKTTPSESIGKLVPVLVRANDTCLPDDDLVPIPVEIFRTFATRLLCAQNQQLADAVASRDESMYRCLRSHALLAIEALAAWPGIESPACAAWKLLLANRQVRWSPVAKVELVGRETVYDLVVPETKVFAVNGGLVVYDTMQFHVPSSEEARRDAIDKMLPSRNLLSSLNFKVHFVPRQEFQLGLWAASAKKRVGEPKRFRTTRDVLSAYKRGELSASDLVEVLEDRR